MGYVSYKALGLFATLLDLDTLLGIFMQGFLAGICGIAVWVCVLLLLKSNELADVWETFHKKIWKAKIVAPDTTM